MKRIVGMVVLTAMGVRAATFSVTGPWQIAVEDEGRKATFAIQPPPRTTVTDERYEQLPVFNPKTGGWCQGARLKGVIAVECTVAYALDPGSVTVRRESDGKVLARDTDYRMNPDWGTFGWITAPAQPTPVVLSYTYARQRIDSVVRRSDGTIGLKCGEPHVALPRIPACGAGETLLGTVHVDARTAQLSDANLFPILPPADNDAPLAFNPPAKTLAKLKAGEAVKVLAWGDSVTDGGYLPECDRWQGQFIRWLRETYPQAKIELVSNGWGGRSSASFLNEPPGSHYNFKESVLDVRPDLVISEFVNDGGLNLDGVNERYGKQILPAFRERGIEWIILTPHYVRMDWMGLKSQKQCDDDPRPYVKAIRVFAKQTGVGLADASRLWGGLWRRGIPYMTLETNNINHPDAFGMSLFVEALKPLFEGK
ncbi:MAG: hypothetical protein J6334_11250 [Kiritimatiellae bacterium]|nr:hypothetical protein [Kiritimatiellia bacterium]